MSLQGETAKAVCAYPGIRHEQKRAHTTKPQCCTRHKTQFMMNLVLEDTERRESRVSAIPFDYPGK